ncbi:hypothetical protein LCGC14_1102380 [marine sediment metagenome]|uniref:Adhesin domain-containing protein n=2 Tax=root TaxID=1 RepID=A0A831QL77_9FLAO|nr:hypothetical protein [Pricia antarctica]
MARIYLLFLFVVNILPAQKIVKKSIINPDIEVVNLDVSDIYQISINTVIGNEMLIEASIDGEYSKEILVNIDQSGNTLFVNSGFFTNFTKPNDKLSAHKVISIALKVSLPEHKKVLIYGTECNVSAKGNYDTITITLSDGRCALENIQGTAKVATQSGNISILADSGKIRASSKYGNVGKNIVPFGDSFYDIHSVTGDILLNKIN